MDQETKDKHSKRIQQKENHIKKQLQLAKNYGYHKLSSYMHNWRYLKEPHRGHKKNIFNCGDPNCLMCMNPRKAFGEKTMQEKKFEQKKLHEE
ncbi:MAG: hypothetical protein EBU90_13980 [Proteobacteria bacterium]|nr:hypothetical protein [Pseudomonadota bacterium]